MLENEILIRDFKAELPDHSSELFLISERLKKIKEDLKYISSEKKLDDQIHDMLYEKIIRYLDVLGQLSTPAFEVNDQIKEFYDHLHMKDPVKAKEAWLEDYADIHHPYNLLKNRCFNLLDELDQLYELYNNKKPLNYNL